MNKKKGSILVIGFLLISVFILLLINKSIISNENSSLKSGQGEVIKVNVLYILLSAKDEERDLADNNISNLNRDYWKFNEFALFDMPKTAIPYYLLSIRNDLSELIRLNETNSSKQEIDECKTVLGKQILGLETSLTLIIKDCGSDANKYFLLNSEGNITMRNVLNIALEEGNISNKK